jgi:hypothetical protein
MPSPPNTNTPHRGLARLMVALGWAVVLIAVTLSGLGRSSPEILLGGGVIPVLFAMILPGVAGGSGGQAGTKSDGRGGGLHPLSRTVGALTGAGLVLLMLYLVRMIANLAAS